MGIKVWLYVCPFVHVSSFVRACVRTCVRACVRACALARMCVCVAKRQTVDSLTNNISFQPNQVLPQGITAIPVSPYIVGLFVSRVASRGILKTSKRRESRNSFPHTLLNRPYVHGGYIHMVICGHVTKVLEMEGKRIFLLLGIINI